MYDFSWCNMLTINILVLFILTEARKNEISNYEDVNSPQKYYPVPFGHIGLEGFNPADGGPIDYGMDTAYQPPSVPFVPNARKYGIKKPNQKKKRDQRSKQIEQANARGRDDPEEGAFIKQKGRLMTNNKENKNDDKFKEDRRPYMDFAKNYASALFLNTKGASGFAHGSLPDRITTKPPFSPTPYTEIRNLKETTYPQISVSTWPPPWRRREVINFNWTTCDEFASRAVFSPKDIIGIEWVPFYIWSGGRTMPAEIHTFQYPSIKLVHQYRKMLSPVIKKKLNWDAPKLLMKALMTEVLLIASDRYGKFDGLIYIEVPESVKDLKSAVPYPVLSYRVKMVGSYLAYMSCDREFAVIMAPVGTEPNTIQTARDAAAFLKFRGIGHLVQRDLNEERFVAERMKMLEQLKEEQETI